MDESLERMYRWYVLGCRMQEQTPMSRNDFAEHHLLQAVNGDLLTHEVFNRTPGEWELAREDAAWTVILQRLSHMNLAAETSDLVAAIQAAFQAGWDDENDGGTGRAGIPAYRLPFSPVLVGARAKLHPHVDPEPQWRDP